MGYQKGDVRVVINGRCHTLRLTIGALADISIRLSAPSPQALSKCLRSLSSAQARVLLDCLSLPPLIGAGGSAAFVSDEDIKALLPDICRVFEQAFKPPEEII